MIATTRWVAAQVHRGSDAAGWLSKKTENRAGGGGARQCGLRCPWGLAALGVSGYG